ncbi:MAG: hypothetical protein BroJett030_23020 [Alphaproteobacteria bacterium]|nr:MAG: hypothetical protein BroJett030_23020 [Alphaproteobacteria bacterium]
MATLTFPRLPNDRRVAFPARRRPPVGPGRRAPGAAGAPVVARIGSLEARLARGQAELRAVQRLRYEVFYREMAARPHAVARLLRRDADDWDRVCDHLVVIDTSEAAAALPATGGGRIVGTYRFLTAARAATAGIGFYTQSEFDIATLVARHRDLHFMELGRSCVLPAWRNRRTIELLWAATWAYVLGHGVDVMIGCASFAGTDPDELAEPLAFLHHHAAPPPEWDVAAGPGRAVPTNRLDAGAVEARRALHALPPLIKGYLRLGAWFGREAVIDRQFATTDVLVILPVSRINPRYVSYYGADASRHAVAAR